VTGNCVNYHSYVFRAVTDGYAGWKA